MRRAGWSRAAVLVVVGAVVLALAVAALLPGAAFAGDSGAGQAEDAGVHQENVDFLRRIGVSDGTECAPGKFCPGEPLERWVFAVWMVRVVDGGDPPAGKGSRFSDVPYGAWWAPHVERLAELSITLGCRNDPEPHFCPDRFVTRAQMASFLVRAYELPPAPSREFSDVDRSSVHAADINSLAAAGITHGCRDGSQFCPDRSVTRAEMASFLARSYVVRDGVRQLPEGVAADVHTVGPKTLPVYYCASPSAGYTQTDLELEAARLTSEVGGFFRRQSSGVVSLTFTAGGVVSPSGFDWRTETISRMYDRAIHDEPCQRAAIDDAGHRQLVVLADVRTGAPWRGFAWIGRGPAVQPTPKWLPSRTVFAALVAHEIGHSVFGLEHPVETGHPNDCSLMSSVSCRKFDLNQTYIADYQKEALGWTLGRRPGPVTGLVARGAAVSWSPPDDDGGSPITGYTVAFGVASVRVGAGSTSFTVEGLGPGRHVVTVTAHNSVGAGPEESTTVQVLAVPGPVKGLVASGATVSWSPPEDDGGSPVTGYTVAFGVASVRVGAGSTTFTVEGLGPGRHVVTVIAHNSVGAGPEASTVVTIPPPPPQVRLSRGGPGPTTPPRPGDGRCSSSLPDCRWLQIELSNFAPGRYRVYCAHDGWNNGQYPPGSFADLVYTVGSNGTLTITDLCFINIPTADGRGVIIWVGESTQPHGQYRWTSNWLR